jgi:hypothetical protein
MSAGYEFWTVWRVAGTLEEVKAILGDAEALPRWWPSVYLDVAVARDGAAGFALTATGDLDGNGRWTFQPDGPEVVITYHWRVAADKALLRRLSWLLRPVFAANHRWAMARGEESLRLELRRRRAANAVERGLVPPPPPTFRRDSGRQQGGVSPMRSFNPELVGSLECRTWVTYYRREWGAFLIAAVRLVREAFRLSWPRTVLGAWWVLRANQHWAPFPDNHPEDARRCMRRFYRLVARQHEETFDVDRAAELEVHWWRLHRDLQHRNDGSSGSEEELIRALQALYADVYGVPAGEVRAAAAERSTAMVLSDRWVAEGADLSSPLIGPERTALVRSLVHPCRVGGSLVHPCRVGGFR